MAAVALVTVVRVTVTTAMIVLEMIMIFVIFNSTHTLLLYPSLKRVLVQSKRERGRE